MALAEAYGKLHDETVQGIKMENGIVSMKNVHWRIRFQRTQKLNIER